VNCEVCGTELPHGALFCGECGRAVGARSAKTFHPDSGMPVSAPESVAAPSAPRAPANPSDTAIIQPIVRGRLPELESELPQPVASERTDPVASERIEQDLPPEVVAAERAAARVAGTLDDSDDSDDSDEGDDRVSPAVEEPAMERPRSVPPVLTPPRPNPFPWGDRGPAVFSDSDELEQTLIVPRREVGERFILQFSTGESVTVFGSGLLGRNPAPQPTEYFDQLVSISDPGKSVSKTHLEFGQEGGSFWVSDRFSGNGSVVREPESSPRRLVAGKRYRIVRGTRVDIGEQFFVVS
jgi:hypothetical protein